MRNSTRLRLASNRGRQGLQQGPDARRRSAFTLLEIMLVMGLLVVLAGLTWPLYSNILRGEELPTSAENVRGLLTTARAESVMRHARCRVRFEPDKQQPIVEFEKDPIREPNVFEAVDTSNWIQGPVLMGDVQVHSVTPGRPLYTKPISTKKSAKKEGEDAEEEEEIRQEHAEGGESLGGGGADDDAEVEVDERRPAIVFEVNGSTDWATVVVARTMPKDELREQDAQVWIELDGRTGLARIRPKVTEVQLADAEFYVAREKLEPPDRYDLSDKSLDLGEGLGGLAGGGGSPLDALLKGADGKADGGGGGTGEGTDGLAAAGTMLGGGAGGDPAGLDTLKDAAGEAGMNESGFGNDGAMGQPGMDDPNGFGGKPGQMGEDGSMPGTRSGFGSRRGGGAGRFGGGRFGEGNGQDGTQGSGRFGGGRLGDRRGNGQDGRFGGEDGQDGGPGGGRFGGRREDGQNSRFGSDQQNGQDGRFGSDQGDGQDRFDDKSDTDPRQQPDPSQDTADLSSHDQQVLRELDAMLANDPEVSPQEREQIRRDFLEALRRSASEGEQDEGS